MKQTLSNQFPQKADIRPGYDTFFAGIQRLTVENTINETLGEALQRHVREFLPGCDLRDFSEFSEERYGRIYLGKDAGTGWEALMMCWKQGNRTSIHGHPQLAAYNFAAGRFLVETFEKGTNGAPVLTGSFQAGAGEGFYAVGRAGTFDNHIHRITCLSERGHSLHIYSDDARRGEVYE